MGLAPSSQIAQRLANVIVRELYRAIDEQEEVHNDAESEVVRAWLHDRRELAEDDYGTHARLYAVAMFTDDPTLTVVGVRRTARVLAALHRLIGPRGLGLMEAKQAKWQVGVATVWLGIAIAPQLGIVWIPPAKALRAAEAIQKAIDGRANVAEYRQLLGLLEHIRGALNGDAIDAADLYDGVAQLLDVDDVDVPLQPSQARTAALRAWKLRILNFPGASLLSAVRPAPPPENAFVWHITSDAAVGDVAADGRAAMGGYCYGYWWHISTLAAVTIPVAEFAAAIISVILFAPLLEDAEHIRMEVDALATPAALTSARPRSAGLRAAYAAAMQAKTVQRLLPKLLCEHVYGENNTASDAASRRKWDVLQSVAAQLGHKLTRVEPDEEAMGFLRTALQHAGAGLHVPPPEDEVDKSAPGGQRQGDIAAGTAEAERAPDGGGATHWSRGLPPPSDTVDFPVDGPLRSPFRMGASGKNAAAASACGQLFEQWLRERTTPAGEMRWRGRPIPSCVHVLTPHATAEHVWAALRDIRDCTKRCVRFICPNSACHGSSDCQAAVLARAMRADPQLGSSSSTWSPNETIRFAALGEYEPEAPDTPWATSPQPTFGERLPSPKSSSPPDMVEPPRTVIHDFTVGVPTPQRSLVTSAAALLARSFPAAAESIRETIAAPAGTTINVRRVGQERWRGATERRQVQALQLVILTSPSGDPPANARAMHAEPRAAALVLLDADRSKQATDAVLLYLAVDAASRRRGLAAAVYWHCAAAAKQRGASRFVVLAKDNALWSRRTWQLQRLPVGERVATIFDAGGEPAPWGMPLSAPREAYAALAASARKSTSRGSGAPQRISPSVHRLLQSTDELAGGSELDSTLVPDPPDRPASLAEVAADTTGAILKHEARARAERAVQRALLDGHLRHDATAGQRAAMAQRAADAMMRDLRHDDSHLALHPEDDELLSLSCLRLCSLLFTSAP
jgi:GNAT superfamily N-acetyltransferase